MTKARVLLWLMILFLMACQSIQNIHLHTPSYLAGAYKQVAACQVSQTPTMQQLQQLSTVPLTQKQAKTITRLNKVLHPRSKILWIQQDFRQSIFTLEHPPRPYFLSDHIPQWYVAHASTPPLATPSPSTTPSSSQSISSSSHHLSPPSQFLQCASPLPFDSTLKVSTKIPQSPHALTIQMKQWQWGREYRTQLMQIYDVALDIKQNRMYLVGEYGLWSWKLNTHSIVPLTLPPHITPPLSRIYQEGGAWWIRQGRPQDIRKNAHLVSLHAHHAQALHRQHDIAPRKTRIQLPLANGLLTAHRGDVSFTWQSYASTQHTDDSHTEMQVHATSSQTPISSSSPSLSRYVTPMIHDVAILDPYHIAIAHELGVDIWQKKPDTQKLTRLYTLTLQQASIRILVHQDTLYIIGRSFGILWSKIDQLNAKLEE